MYAAALHVVAAMAYAVEALDDQSAQTPSLGECMRRSASSRNGTLQPSHHACIGPPCCAPLRRNRTCLFRNLLFLPPARDERQPRRPRTSGFHYLVPERKKKLMTSDDGNPTTHGIKFKVSIQTYVRNTILLAHSLRPPTQWSGQDWLHITGQPKSSAPLQIPSPVFAPEPMSILEAKGLGALRPSDAHAPCVISTPIFLGSALHWNPGHNMVDAFFPAVSALVRLRAVARASRVVRSHERLQAYSGAGQRQKGYPGVGSAHIGPASSLPDPETSEPFIYLETEPAGNQGHLQMFRMQREWARTVAGAVWTLNDLVERCPPPAGCVLRDVFVGSGHIGISSVNELNIGGGTRDERALFAYRSRVYARFKVPPSPGPLLRDKLPLVLMVESKRVVTNYRELATSMASQLAFGQARVRLIKWEGMPFVEQVPRSCEQPHACARISPQLLELTQPDSTPSSRCLHCFSYSWRC